MASATRWRVTYTKDVNKRQNRKQKVSAAAVSRVRWPQPRAST